MNKPFWIKLFLALTFIIWALPAILWYIATETYKQVWGDEYEHS
jgi:hypothetical protein